MRREFYYLEYRRWEEVPFRRIQPKRVVEIEEVNQGESLIAKLRKFWFKCTSSVLRFFNL